MVGAPGNGNGRGVVEALGETYEGLVEENRGATSTSWSARLFARVGAALAYLVGALTLALIVVGALALIASLWRVVRWGFGL